MADEDLNDVHLSHYGGSGRWSAGGGSWVGRPSPQHSRYGVPPAPAALPMPPPPQHQPPPHQSGVSRSCLEAEDLSGCGRGAGRSGLYYSPPGTSYTIVERPVATTAISHKPPHRAYSSQPSSHAHTPRNAPSSAKKRPMSPEEVLRMFGPGPGRRAHSPASSPPSTTHHAHPQHQQHAHMLHPNTQDDLIVRTVSMVRPPDAPHGFGFCVKGGNDGDVDRVGVYISRVEEGSVAERVGLRPGDSILEVNGIPFTAVSHDEALKMLKSCRKLSMTVRSPQLPPEAMQLAPPTPLSGATGPWLMRQTYSWMDRNGRPVSPPAEYARAAPPVILTPKWNYLGNRGKEKGSTKKVDLVIDPGQSLGLMIRGGLEYNLGIFITGVDKDSVADRSGLMIGDQILEVNGQSFLDVTHDEAVNQLKIHKKMSMIVRDVGKVPHSCTAYDDFAWDSASAFRESRGATQQMVEEKARVLLTRSELTSLAYYQEEYSARRMTIEAFVTVLIELLNTPEKHTLLTELREMVFPEDRPRYDELVYRRHSSDHDRGHRRKGGDPHTLLMSNLHELPGPNEFGSASRPCKIPVLVEAPSPTKEEFRTPSEDSGVCLTDGQFSQRGTWTAPSSPVVFRQSQSADLVLSKPIMHNQNGYLDGLRTHLGGWTQRVKSWYWGRPLELAHKLSRSFDMKDDVHQLTESGPNARPRQRQDAGCAMTADDGLMRPMVVPESEGVLRITVRKTDQKLGIALEGGSDTKHPLPRIINVHEEGAAFSSGVMEVGQLILEVDGQSLDGLPHMSVAQVIADAYASRDRPEIEFLIVEAKKSNLEPKPTALIFMGT